MLKELEKRNFQGGRIVSYWTHLEENSVFGSLAFLISRICTETAILFLAFCLIESENGEEKNKEGELAMEGFIQRGK